MNTSSIGERLQNWLDSQPHTVPLRAIADTSGSGLDYRSQIQDEIAGSRFAADSMVAAMLWLRVGIIEPAHVIVQNGTTPLASYLHGVVHRLEGDYWNAKYWFRQVNDKQMLQSLSNCVFAWVEEVALLDIATGLKIIKGKVFSPAEFVSAHEHLSTKPNPSIQHTEAMERIAWIEWDSLWRIARDDA